MSVFTKLARNIFAAADASGNARKVDNSEAAVWGTEVERIINAGLSNGGWVYDTRANLFADLGLPANASPWVVADSTAAFNGIYRKSGAAGTGSYTRIADLPYSFVKLTDVGAGTANAIQATSVVPTSNSVLRTFNVFEPNTGNVTISENGGAPISLKTMSGAEIPAAGLPAGATVAYVYSGTEFRLLSDIASAAIQAAAEAAQAAAEAARDQALAAVPSVFPATIDVLRAVDTDDHQFALVTDKFKGGPFKFQSVDLSNRVLGDYVFTPTSFSEADNTLNVISGTFQFNSTLNRVYLALDLSPYIANGDYFSVDSTINGLSQDVGYVVANLDYDTAIAGSGSFQLLHPVTGAVMDITSTSNAASRKWHRLTPGLALLCTTSGRGFIAGEIYFAHNPTMDTARLCTVRSSSLEVGGPTANIVDVTSTGNPSFRHIVDWAEGLIVIPPGKARDGSEGGWERLFSGPKDARWFDLTDSTTDVQNTDALQAAFDTGGHIVIPHAAQDIVHHSALLLRPGSVVEWSGTFTKLTEDTWLGGAVCAYPFLMGGAQADLVTCLCPMVDTGNLGWMADEAYGENGISGAFGNEIKIIGGIVKNARRGSNGALGSGGQGISFQNTVGNCSAIGTMVVDCDIGVTGGGYSSGPFTNILFDVQMERVGRPVQVNLTESPPPYSVEVSSMVFKVVGHNCGREGITGDEEEFGCVMLDRASNITVQAQFFNDSDYGNVGAVVCHPRGKNCNINVDFWGNANYLVDHEVAPNFGTTGVRESNAYRVRHMSGTVNTKVLHTVASESASTHSNNFYDIVTSTVTGSNNLFSSELAQADTVGAFRSQTTGKTTSGTLNVITGPDYPSAETFAYNGSLRFNGLTISFGSDNQSISAAQDISFVRGGSQKLRLTANGMQVNLPSSSSGLASGECWIDATAGKAIKVV